jgi:DNA ligase 1
MIFKPMLACDADETKIKYPCIVQPKIDGVRSLHHEGFRGRSLKQHANSYLSELFKPSFLNGYDGELIIGSNPTLEDLCRKTASLTSSGVTERTEHVTWYLFDNFLHPDLPYEERIEMVCDHIQLLRSQYGWENYLEVVQSHRVNCKEELLNIEEQMLKNGYEGVIVRGINNPYKFGRSTVREGGLLRIKRFIESECVVIEIQEGESNENEAQTNELGYTYRTSHKEGKVKNGMVGALICKALATVKDPQSSKVLFNKGDIIKVSAGKMDHDLRVKYFEDKSLLIDKTITFKFFPKGGKDKPRFPTFKCLRHNL